MDLSWNKQLSILKFRIILVDLLPKFFYSHTWTSQVLQRFIVLIILKIIKKSPLWMKDQCWVHPHWHPASSQPLDDFEDNEG
jgi:hypothetical protein